MEWVDAVWNSRGHTIRKTKTSNIHGSLQVGGFRLGRNVSPETIRNGFRKAGIVYQEIEKQRNADNEVYQDESSDADDDDISSEVTEQRLQAVLSHFNDDSDEASDFEGFPATYDESQ